MRITRRLTILAFLGLTMVGLTAVDGIARGSSAKGMNAEQLARLAVDIHEINNLMSLHAWYHAALMHDVEIEEIWSKRDDIVLWFEASGRFEGPENIKACYGKKVSLTKPSAPLPQSSFGPDRPCPIKHGVKPGATWTPANSRDAAGMELCRSCVLQECVWKRRKEDSFLLFSVLYVCPSGGH